MSFLLASFHSFQEGLGTPEGVADPQYDLSEDEMPQKPKTVGTQQNPVVAGAPKSDRAPGRTRRLVSGSSPAKEAAQSLKSRSSRGSANVSQGSAAGTAEHAPPVSQESKPARKTGAKKKTAAGAAAGGESSSARILSPRKPARAAGVVKQPEAGGQLHSQDDSRIDGNGHFDHSEIARLAYSYWEARGYQGGSSEEDWYRARDELRLRSQLTEKTKPGKRTRKA